MHFHFSSFILFVLFFFYVRGERKVLNVFKFSVHFVEFLPSLLYFYFFMSIFLVLCVFLSKYIFVIYYYYYSLTMKRLYANERQ